MMKERAEAAALARDRNDKYLEDLCMYQVHMRCTDLCPPLKRLWDRLTGLQDELKKAATFSHDQFLIAQARLNSFDDAEVARTIVRDRRRRWLIQTRGFRAQYLEQRRRLINREIIRLRRNAGVRQRRRAMGLSTSDES
jgi:hypothetical protein